MKKSEAVKLMNQMAEKLERFADDNTRLTRSLTGRLTGALLPADIDDVLGYLQNNAPNIVTVRQYYDELISLAKDIDRLVAESGASPLESANKLMSKLRYQAHRLARTLHETGQDLTRQKPSETKQNHKTTIIAIIISLFIICIFEFLVHIVPLTWLKNHPNSYALQGSIICLIPCLILALFKPRSRWWWGSVFFALLAVLLSQLGGPADSNVN